MWYVLIKVFTSGYKRKGETKEPFGTYAKIMALMKSFAFSTDLIKVTDSLITLKGWIVAWLNILWFLALQSFQHVIPNKVDQAELKPSGLRLLASQSGKGWPWNCLTILFYMFHYINVSNFIGFCFKFDL